MNLPHVGLLVLVLGAIGAGAAAYFAISSTGWNQGHCEIVASVAPPTTEEMEVPPSLLEEHPALRDAFAEATAARAGVVRMESCEERDALLQDLQALGAEPVNAQHDYVLRSEGQTYRVEIRAVVS